nr:colicin E5-related ribonuclease [Listeria monocytogenes]
MSKLNFTTVTRMQNALEKALKNNETTFNFDEYQKTYRGQMWVLMKNGIVDVEATNAYNTAVLNGELPHESNEAQEEAELLQAVIQSVKEGTDPVTGQEISKAQGFGIISGLVFRYTVGGYKGKKFKIPKAWLNRRKKAREGHIKSDNIKFGSSVKSTKKVNNQMKKRGWSEESVKSVVDHPHTTRKSGNKATGNDATVFYDKDGSYVIIDDKTKEIVQISDKFDKNWVPDAGIADPYKPKGGE